MNKTLFLYWGGRPLSWLRYMTVVSFKKHNPGWRVRVYYPAAPSTDINWNTGEQAFGYEGEDYLDKLGAELVPFEASVVGLEDTSPEVHKSDLFRLWALHKYGGMYADFDIIFTKPLPKFQDRMFCHHPDGHYAIGLIGARKGDPVMKQLLKASKKVQNGRKYQAFGSSLWANTLKEEPEGLNLPKDAVYSCDWSSASSLFNESRALPKEAVGIHWYGGSLEVARWEGLLSPDTLNDYPSTITNLLKEALV